MSLPGADELFRTTGGMALSPSLAPRPAAEAPRPETARAVDGTDGAEAADGAEGAPGHAATGQPQEQDRTAQPYGGRGAQPGSVPGPAQPAQVPPAAQPPARQQAGRTAGAAAPGAAVPAGRAVPPAGAAARHAAPEEPTGTRARPRGRAARRPSGRERHDEKITVYVSAEELMDLEHTRLVLRGEHGLAVDRGRIVREAIAVVLADLEQRGEASILVRRLRGR
ncbi:hypothetical protein ACWGB8_13420 [Kitasatospora sp. NPDC054939]